MVFSITSNGGQVGPFHWRNPDRSWESKDLETSYSRSVDCAGDELIMVGIKLSFQLEEFGSVSFREPAPLVVGTRMLNKRSYVLRCKKSIATPCEDGGYEIDLDSLFGQSEPFFITYS